MGKLWTFCAGNAKLSFIQKYYKSEITSSFPNFEHRTARFGKWAATHVGTIFRLIWPFLDKR